MRLPRLAVLSHYCLSITASQTKSNQLPKQTLQRKKQRIDQTIASFHLAGMMTVNVSSCLGATSKTQTKAKKSVQFSNEQEIFSIDYTKSEMKHRWTSASDIRRYQETLIRDVIDVRAVLAVKSPRLMTFEDLCECVGIDMYLSSAVAREAKQRKIDLLDAVLREQQRQKREGFIIDGEEGIRRVSEGQSDWAVTRAHTMAKDYFGMKEEAV